MPACLPASTAQDLEIPAEVVAEVAASSAAGGDSRQFVAPTPGVPATQRWQTKCSLAAEQAAAGAFDTAMRLLTRCAASAAAAVPRCPASLLAGSLAAYSHSPFHPFCPRHPPCRQAGIVAFEPLRPYFLELYGGAQGVLPGLPGLPSLVTALDASWSSDAAKQEPTAPALVRACGLPTKTGVVQLEGDTGGITVSHPHIVLLLPDRLPAPPQVYSLAQLEDQLKRAYRTVTEGKFG